MEEITFPPLSELIQDDEYKHEDNKMGLVYIFYSTDDKEGMLLLKQTFNNQQYNVLPENTIKITKREAVLNDLQRIAREDYSDKTCLIIFILGNTIMEGDLILPEKETNNNWENCLTPKDIWINFTGEHCDSFKNKPKLFIFQGSQTALIGRRRFYEITKQEVKIEHDFPAEADILMIYNKVNASRRNHFIEHLCNGLKKFGKEDDVLGIVTRFEQQHDQRPLIISTLTRKFFMSPNKYRGYHYECNSGYDSLQHSLCTLDKKVDFAMDHLSNSKKIFGRWFNFRSSTKCETSTTPVMPLKKRWRF